VGANVSLPPWPAWTSTTTGVAEPPHNTGKHKLGSSGYEYRRTTIDQFFDAGYRGRLNFRLARGLRGRRGRAEYARPAATPTAARPRTATRCTRRDSWQASRRVTVNVGVRWDYYGVIGERNRPLLDPGYDEQARSAP